MGWLKKTNRHVLSIGEHGALLISADRAHPNLRLAAPEDLPLTLKEAEVRVVVALPEVDLAHQNLPKLSYLDRKQFYWNQRQALKNEEGGFKGLISAKDRMSYTQITLEKTALLTSWLQALEKSGALISGLSLFCVEMQETFRFIAKRLKWSLKNPWTLVVTRDETHHYCYSVFYKGRLVLTRLIPIASDLLKDFEETYYYLQEFSFGAQEACDMVLFYTSGYQPEALFEKGIHAISLEDLRTLLEDPRLTCPESLGALPFFYGRSKACLSAASLTKRWEAFRRLRHGMWASYALGIVFTLVVTGLGGELYTQKKELTAKRHQEAALNREIQELETILNQTQTPETRRQKKYQQMKLERASPLEILSQFPLSPQNTFILQKISWQRAAHNDWELTLSTATMDTSLTPQQTIERFAQWIQDIKKAAPSVEIQVLQSPYAINPEETFAGSSNGARLTLEGNGNQGIIQIKGGRS